MDLDRIAGLAEQHAASGESLAGVLPTEALGHGRIYLCAFAEGESRTWLALDEDGAPVTSLAAVREAASIAALCEIAEEAAGGGDLDDLRARLAEIREEAAPPGIEDAEAAAAALSETMQASPRVASHAYLDDIGAAARRLEQTLGDDAGSPFAVTMQQSLGVVEELTAEVERAYKGPLA